MELRTAPLFGPGGNAEDFAQEGHKSTIEAPKWLKEKGLDTYEFECGRGVNAREEMLVRVAEEAEKYHIALSLHAPYFISLSGTVLETRLKSIEYIRESLWAAHLLNAHTIVVHCGSCAKITREEALALTKDTLYKTLEALDPMGISIGIETMGKKNQLGTLEEVIEVCKMDPRLAPVVDFGHLNARECGGYFVTKEDYYRVFDLIGEQLGDSYAQNLHCHFSKIMWTGQGEKEHLTFSDTEYGPNFEPLMDCLVEHHLTPSIICESAGTQAQDALMMKNYYREMASKS